MPSNKKGFAALYEVTEKLKEQDATAVPQYRSTAVLEHNLSAEKEIVDSSSTGVPEYRSTEVPESASVIPEKQFYRKPNQTSDRLDRLLTPAESKVLDQLVRLTIGFNQEVRQVRISTLQSRTGYRSDKTVRAALNGLEMKGVIAKVTHHNSPLGDEYRVLSLNAELPQYRSTPVENTAVLESKSTGQLNTVLNNIERSDDDEAFATMCSALRRGAKDVTGREPSVSDAPRWAEVADVLMTELKIAAGRTTVSSAPSFLAEHLRRRLFKKEKAQLEREEREAPQVKLATADVSQCPDCFGSGMWYPDGYENAPQAWRVIHMENSSRFLARDSGDASARSANKPTGVRGKVVSLWKGMRRLVDGDDNDPGLKISENAGEIGHPGRFLKAVAKELEACLMKEAFSPPGLPLCVPQEFNIFIDSETDKEWVGQKRRTLEKALNRALVEKVREIGRGSEIETPAPIIILRVDGTLGKNQIRIKPSWEHTRPGTTHVVSHGTKQPPADDPDITHVYASEPSDGDATQVILSEDEEKPLYRLEVWREETREAVMPVRLPLVRVGRGAHAVPVDVRLRDPNISRLHALIERDAEGSYWITARGQNPTMVSDREIPRNQRVRIEPYDRISICSFTLCVSGN